MSNLTETKPGDTSLKSVKPPLFAGITGYHWLVFSIAAAGWLFDCMSQRIFILARTPAMQELLGTGAASTSVTSWGTWATTSMILGWATGGILFGIMSDRVGRVKTMVATLLAFTGFSGLTGLAQTPMQFVILRFLAGLGIGGMFGSATTLLAESVPAGVRSLALGTMQALSAFGNIAGSQLSLLIQPSQKDFFSGYSGWRFIFFAAAVPAVMAVFIPFIIREPEVWVAARRKAAESGHSSHRVGSLSDLFSHPIWRGHAMVGIGLGLAGMAGLWGIGFFSPELINIALKGLPPERVDHVKGLALTFNDVGAFFGMFGFTFAANYFGRKKAFFVAFILSLAAVIFVFNNLHTATDAYWMLPMMAFCQMSVFGGYSIYFPELFPTRLRGTGISFCYNTVRYLAAVFPVMLGQLNAHFSAQGRHDPFRLSATILSSVFLIGLVALIWAPETKGKPLPED